MSRVMPLNPALRARISAASEKYRSEVASDELGYPEMAAETLKLVQVVETVKDAARLAGLADPSRREEFILAANFVDGFILGELDADTE